MLLNAEVVLIILRCCPHAEQLEAHFAMETTARRTQSSHICQVSQASRMVDGQGMQLVHVAASHVLGSVHHLGHVLAWVSGTFAMFQAWS